MVENAEKLDALLVNLVLIFKNAAMQQMGKLINPLSGKVERNLEQARFSIDMIDMLKEKTRGNLSQDMERLLDATLLELRMNYVEEVQARKEPEPPQAPEPKREPSAQEPKKESTELAGEPEAQAKEPQTMGRAEKSGSKPGPRTAARPVASGKKPKKKPKKKTEPKGRKGAKRAS
jgi:hypothetical protein